MWWAGLSLRGATWRRCRHARSGSPCVAVGTARFLGQAVLAALIFSAPRCAASVVTGYLLLLTFGQLGRVGACSPTHLGIVAAFR